MDVTVIIFSKDRPFQLGEYLRTLFQYSRDSLGVLNVFVLAHIHEDYATGYDKVAASFPQITLLRETNFAQQLIDLVESAAEEGFILFGVDDALFCASIPWSAATLALTNIPSLQCVHLKLCPGLSYCHPAGSPQVQTCEYYISYQTCGYYADKDASHGDACCIQNVHGKLSFVNCSDRSRLRADVTARTAATTASLRRACRVRGGQRDA